jgi:aryl-alcohol dehydrogenase-like predicted oxidoreductase
VAADPLPAVVPRQRLGRSGLEVSRWCLGANPFGWTVDAPTASVLLDAYIDAGGNFIDTADSYPPGSAGGTSEQIIGAWLKASGRRDQIVLATKIGAPRAGETRVDLSPNAIHGRTDASLRRLGVDHVDLLYAHLDDRTTPLQDTLEALDALVVAGKVRYLAASNFSAPRLAKALEITRGNGASAFIALQTHYNLLERTRILNERASTSEVYEGELSDLCVREGLGVVPYWALAKGFFTGKYRGQGTERHGRVTQAARSAPDGGDFSARAAIHRPHEYLDHGGAAVLDVLDELSAERGTTVAALAMGWTLHWAEVVSTVASVRTLEQLRELSAVLSLELTRDEHARLTDATAFA